MVKLRLSRAGAKKRPFYRLVVSDGRYPRDGRFIEQIGTYDPKGELAAVNIKTDRLDYWLGVGAQATETVQRLIRQHRASTAEAQG